MNKNSSLFTLFFMLLISGLPRFAYSQSNPVALKPAIQIERLMTIQNGSIRLVKDPVTGNLFYTTTSGNIYAVLQPAAAPAYDSLIYTVADHGVQYVQGMAVYDSTLYVSGNNNSTTVLTSGIITRGKVQANGSRLWDTLMITDPYQTADYFDHLFSGVAISPGGDSIYICSGARGDHGEIQTRYGTYPNLRNVPLTTNIYALPTQDPSTILLQNDSIWNDTSAFLYARGIRNTFSMAFDGSGNLFGVENSGDRDHNEEMNWLRRGRHYGFPWIMGDTYNPQQDPGFDPATDLLIPHYSRSWKNGFWGNDPGFPPPPSGLVFDEPIQNIGPDCDKFRDTITGEVKDASDLGMSIGTFTAHRSPLGLVFDRNNVLHPAYRGDGFMLSWTKGYDTCGCTVTPDTAIGPFVDPSQDLVHLDLSFDSLADNFQLSATRIVSEFEHPVDAAIDSNVIYVLENGYGNTSGLYKITLPVEQACPVQVSLEYTDTCLGNPVSAFAQPSGAPPFSIEWYSSGGSILRSNPLSYAADTLSPLLPGDYYVIVNDSATCRDSLFFSVLPSLDFQIGSVSGTTCIGCNDGVINFSTTGGTFPYTYSSDPTAGNFVADSLINLPAGTYLICATDLNGCTQCDTAIVLEDPNSIHHNFKNISSVLVYPNPASGSVNIQITAAQNGELKIRIIDLQGREQLARITNKKTTNSGVIIQLSLENIPDGNYILETELDGTLHRELLNVSSY